MDPKVSHLTAKQIPEILKILNEVIMTSTSVYYYDPLPIDQIEKWFQQKMELELPVIGILDEASMLLGFATFGPFRHWPAYQYTIEHSIYIHHEHRGLGHATRLLAALIDLAREKKYHNMIAGIDATNLASKRLHMGFGFESCAYIKHAGHKFGKWLDLEFYQLLLTDQMTSKL